MLRKLKQQGIGLLELMLALAIIALLLVMATRYYQSAHQGEQMNEMVGIIQNIRAASADWAAGKADYSTLTNVSQLIDYGLIPKDINDGTNIIAPWGGTTVAIGPAPNDPKQVQVTVSGMPAYACNNITGKFTNQGTTSCSGTTLTVTF